jgi:effector-binding domain-containing protein
MREAVVSKEWGEVKRNGRKIEGWSWEVTFLDNGVVVDRHYYKTEEFAQNAAFLFEEGDVCRILVDMI